METDSAGRIPQLRSRDVPGLPRFALDAVRLAGFFRPRDQAVPNAFRRQTVQNQRAGRNMGQIGGESAT